MWRHKCLAVIATAFAARELPGERREATCASKAVNRRCQARCELNGAETMIAGYAFSHKEMARCLDRCEEEMCPGLPEAPVWMDRDATKLPLKKMQTYTRRKVTRPPGASPRCVDSDSSSRVGRERARSRGRGAGEGRDLPVVAPPLPGWARQRYARGSPTIPPAGPRRPRPPPRLRLVFKRAPWSS